MQHGEGILAYLTARASTLPLLECEECGMIIKGKAHMTAPLTHLISTECFYFIHSFINRLRSIARRFIFLPIYPSLLAMGYHLLASSIRFPIISLASELVERARR